MKYSFEICDIRTVSNKHMNTVSAVPCKAKDITKCRYHSAVNEAEVAFARGDLDAFLNAQLAVAEAARTSDEVKNFFANKTISESPASLPVECEKVLRGKFKRQRIEERANAAVMVSRIMNAEHDSREEKFTEIVEYLTRFYDQDISTSSSAARLLFLQRKWVVTYDSDDDIKIIDLLSAKHKMISRQNIRKGDILVSKMGLLEVLTTRHPTSGRPLLIVSNMHTSLHPNSKPFWSLDNYGQETFTVLDG